MISIASIKFQGCLELHKNTRRHKSTIKSEACPEHFFYTRFLEFYPNEDDRNMSSVSRLKPQ